MVTKNTTVKSPARFVLYVNLDEYYPRSRLARWFLPESVEAQKMRVLSDMRKSGFFSSEEQVIVIPSNGTHLEKLYDQ